MEGVLSPLHSSHKVAICLELQCIISLCTSKLELGHGIPIHYRPHGMGLEMGSHVP